jgi:uncharacterized membrane protein YvlD (DUF360 family)
MAKQRGNQNPYIEEEQTTQWPNKEVIRIRISKKNIQHNGQTMFFFVIRILITSLFGHCVVCSSSIYGFWLPLCLVIVLSVLLRYTDSDYLFVWPLCCLFFFDIRILITSLFGHCVVCSSSIYGFWLPLCLAIVLSVLLRYTDSDYLFVWPLCCLFFFDIRILITSLFGHCGVCSSSIYGFWLPLCLAIVFSVLLWYTDSDFLFVFLTV